MTHTREISFAGDRVLDDKTRIDLIKIHAGQARSSSRISEAIGSDFFYPMSDEILDIVLDSLGVADGMAARQRYYTMFYSDWLQHERFRDEHEFYQQLTREIG